MCAAVIIDGKQISSDLSQDLSLKIKHLQQNHKITPNLAVILVGDDPASHIYVANKIKKAHEIGIKISSYLLPATTPEDKIITLIKSLNEDRSVNGILVQLPLPAYINTHKVINTIDHMKDVDGFTVKNIGLLNSWQDCLEPSTPQGALILIKKFIGNNLAGKKAVILGRSLIVGRPMASILIRESCAVTVLNSYSVDIAEECATADILICAIGKPNFLTAKFVKKGACVIDIGITRVGDKVLGDVNMDEVKKVAGFLTPVPGGVGPMTVVCMLGNTVKAYLTQHQIK